MVLSTAVLICGCMPEVLPSPSPSPTRTPTHWGPISVAPERGPVGTRVVVQGSDCTISGRPPIIYFTNEGELDLTGTVGGAPVSPVTTDPSGHFRAEFVIPPSFGTYQGRGGGALRPGTYRFLSFPPACGVGFTVTPP